MRWRGARPRQVRRGRCRTTLPRRRRHRLRPRRPQRRRRSLSPPPLHRPRRRQARLRRRRIHLRYWGAVATRIALRALRTRAVMLAQVAAPFFTPLRHLSHSVMGTRQRAATIVSTWKYKQRNRQGRWLGAWDRVRRHRYHRVRGQQSEPVTPTRRQWPHSPATARLVRRTRP